MNNRLLLITENKRIWQQVKDLCETLEGELTRAASANDAEKILAERSFDLVFCDYETFQRLRKKWPDLSMLLYAEQADSQEAIEAIKGGALDYLVHPIAPESLDRAIQEGLRISRDIHVPAVYAEEKEDPTVDPIVGQSPAMKEVYKLIGFIAPRDINVLITGESGTGKELVARAILHHSPRQDKPFLAVNCAAIPDTLLESELFGHEKGAFTGADHRRIGRFEQASGGTLFLDEVGDIPLATQAKLLRVLQNSSFQRLGGTELLQSDVRIIAATHQPLEQLISERRFRQDLYYRLRVASIHVPALREREVDVVLLAHHFVERFNRTFRTRIRTFAPETLPLLLTYPWPGNVRELENAIKSALVVARGSVMRPEFLPEHIRKQATMPSRDLETKESLDVALSRSRLRTLANQLLAEPTLSGKIHRTATEMIEREVICACLEQTRGQLAPAARLLGISRATLRKKMAQLEIRVEPSLRVNT